MTMKKINQSDAAKRLKKALKRRKPSAVGYCTDTKAKSIFEKAFTVIFKDLRKV